MSESEAQVIIYDFDGVIIDTTDIKHSSYLESAEHFAPGSGDMLDKALNDELVGAERSAVADWFCLRVQSTTKIEFVRMFAGRVKTQLANLPLARGFLELHQYAIKNCKPQYIVSAAPQSEIESMLVARNIPVKNFQGIFGNEFGKKADILKHIIETQNIMDASKVLFLGDMPSDYFAAKKVGAQFKRVSSFAGARAKWPEELPSTSLAVIANAFLISKVT